ncbi:Molybdenum transport ATP-binding protein ModC (TC 3.A.1.8.1) [Polaromonas sp. CG9_12]|nr:Molybdenum transport ATP-binding protein ModC (TC 3.A.1.8.1) [Polaromonas sp. CG9_12]
MDSNRIRLSLQRPAFTLNADLLLPQRGIAVLFGPSGSGKTTLLRCVAGLEQADGALVEIAGQIWQDDSRRIFLPTWQRPLGYVFQEASLFDHLDVRGNLTYGLRRVKSGETAMALEAAIKLLGIGALLERRTHQLSGGERQRVAIARALATRPRLLLLDEPLAALDHARRQDILPWLERLRDELHIPMLYVTHSADEVARLADTLIVLDQGRIVSAGAVAEVLARVDLPVVLGEDAGALLEGAVVERDARWHLMRMTFNGGSLWLSDSGVATGTRARVRVLARDVSLSMQAPNATSIQNLLQCVVRAIVPDAHPSQALVQLTCGESVLLARITARAADALGLEPGKPVWAQVKSAALVS